VLVKEIMIFVAAAYLNVTYKKAEEVCQATEVVYKWYMIGIGSMHCISSIVYSVTSLRAMEIFRALV
jgi:hypothetical protein